MRPAERPSPPLHRGIGYGIALSVPFWGALLVYLTR